MYSRTLILLGLTSVFSLVVGNESTYGECADNMHYMQCGSGCPRTCADVNNTHTQKDICEMPCKPGCFCNDGYVFENAQSQICVSTSSCMKAYPDKDDCQHSCQANAQYTNCSTACPITCDNYSNPPKMCTMQCVIGCACKDGYVLENATSQNCISPSECKKPCLDNAQYKTCGTACPLSCENYYNPPVCIKNCVNGCFCNEGYVLENATSKHCIAQSECKKYCQANAQYTSCGTSCPITCDNYSNPPEMCTMECVIGCACKDGYVLENENSKNCISPSECKKPCLDNAHYTTCGTACPLTCENYDNPPACTQDCVNGCFCDKGYVLENANSKHCIPQSDCRKTCKENAHYMQCGTACPLTCNNYTNHLQVCTKQCLAGCVCDDGYVLENKISDLCVHKTACKSPCQANAHYETCGTACPKTCANVTNPTLHTKPTPRPCTRQCKPGCFCNQGYVLENAASRVCVNESICKACEAHSHFITCASTCPLNCQNYKNPPKICTLICLSGCVCEEGYIFKSGESGPCVCSSEC